MKSPITLAMVALASMIGQSYSHLSGFLHHQVTGEGFHGGTAMLIRRSLVSVKKHEDLDIERLQGLAQSSLQRVWKAWSYHEMLNR